MSKRQWMNITTIEPEIIAMREAGKTRQVCHRSGRPQKNAQTSEMEYKHEIQRLKTENKLLRDFLRVTGRKWAQGQNTKSSVNLGRSTASSRCVVSSGYLAADTTSFWAGWTSQTGMRFSRSRYSSVRCSAGRSMATGGMDLAKEAGRVPKFQNSSACNAWVWPTQWSPSPQKIAANGRTYPQIRKSA